MFSPTGVGRPCSCFRISFFRGWNYLIAYELKQISVYLVFREHEPIAIAGNTGSTKEEEFLPSIDSLPGAVLVDLAWLTPSGSSDMFKDSPYIPPAEVRNS